MALVVELPPEARFFARMQGENTGLGYSAVDWVVLDIRNAVEGLRVMGAMRGEKHPSRDKAKREYREWKNYPGAKAHARRKANSVVQNLKRFAAGTTADG